MAQLSLTVKEPFSLVETALSHGWYETPPFDFDPASQTLWMALRTGRGASSVALRVREAGRKAGRVRLTIQADRDLAATDPLRRSIRESASRSLQLGAALDGFYSVCGTYPPLHWVPGRQAGRILRGLTVFEDLVKSICGTNTTWKQAVRSIHRLCAPLPRPAGTPPGLSAFPKPREILAWGKEHLEQEARVGYRAAAILELCEKVVARQVDLTVPLQEDIPGRDIFRWFQTLRGIGPITAAYLTGLYGHYDYLSIDSLTLSHLGKKYHGGRKATRAEVEARYEPFGSLRLLAYWFEFLGDVDRTSWRPPDSGQESGR